MTPLQVFWARCMAKTQRVWCLLRYVDTESIKSNGVYVIWHGGPAPRVIYVGHGDIAGRINHYRSSSRILQYESFGPLMVTWASVPEADRQGVENYLANVLRPIRGNYENISPLPINLPWPDPPSVPQ